MPAALSVALLCKLGLYSSSAMFHLYPYARMADERRAFIADLLAVPLSAYGCIMPFLASHNVKREVGIGIAVLLANAFCVAWQTRGQVGLRTPPGRSDVPRLVVVTLYLVWCLGFIGMASSFSPLWVVLVLMTVFGAHLADGISKQHEEEPTAPWGLWHMKGIYSAHEDFHVVLLAADVLWLTLALRAQALI
eukprot:CAMPEP_0115849866 /NCGR_PEP_ID=MMETSP0287-20121206/11671_1 /TAXON_ID=412157 /ORGANISM="Chrysochromulina rotalis, Strain UIO044" /LENGTH=191 /DNA_ID=CAMNT_0003303849 /DNA_START=382 /DNA_END=957 /DNA_ORIENTATION=+